MDTSACAGERGACVKTETFKTETFQPSAAGWFWYAIYICYVCNICYICLVSYIYIDMRKDRDLPAVCSGVVFEDLLEPLHLRFFFFEGSASRCKIMLGQCRNSVPKGGGWIHIHTCVHTQMHVRSCVDRGAECMYTRTSTHTYLHACTHARMHACTHAHSVQGTYHRQSSPRARCTGPA